VVVEDGLADAERPAGSRSVPRIGPASNGIIAADSAGSPPSSTCPINWVIVAA
jgi:hypothetical protein